MEKGCKKWLQHAGIEKKDVLHERHCLLVMNLNLGIGRTVIFGFTAMPM